MDIIKISLDELNILSSKKNVIDALKELFSDNQMVFLSLGKDGSLFYHNGKTITASSIDVNPVDTTGAGDAFYSYILYKLDRNSALLDSDKEIKQMLKEANVAGALSTLKKGATDVMPSLSQIHLEAAKID